jgi:hypothetical protein
VDSRDLCGGVHARWRIRYTGRVSGSRGALTDAAPRVQPRRHARSDDFSPLIGRVGLEPTTCGLTHHFGFRRRALLVLTARVRGPDSAFTCARSGQVAPVESLHLPSTPWCLAWLGVGILLRSPNLSAFTRTVSDAVLRFY